MTTLLTTVEAARYLRLNPNTLNKWRGSGRGPVFVRVGRRVLYRQEDLNAWLETQREAPHGAALPAIPAIPAIPGPKEPPRG